MKPMTIGRVAQRAGVSADTIRYYQRIGLIEDTERLESGYRVFTQDTVRTMKFIKRAQELGFSLAEIRELLAFRGEGTRCRDVRSAAARKVEIVNRKIKDLSAIRDALAALICSCEEGNGAMCPILESLDREEET